eukprot:1969157-Amphidinium_carterae.1
MSTPAVTLFCPSPSTTEAHVPQRGLNKIDTFRFSRSNRLCVASAGLSGLLLLTQFLLEGYMSSTKCSSMRGTPFKTQQQPTVLQLHDA